MAEIDRIVPCLWFDRQAEEAVRFYTGLFPDSGIGEITRYGSEGFEIHGMPAGTALTVAFRLAGRDFTALKRGAAVHLQRGRLPGGALPEPGGGGPLLGRPLRRRRGGGAVRLAEGPLRPLLAGGAQRPDAHAGRSRPDPARAGRVMQALHQQRKLDLPTLERAYAGT